MTFPTNSLKAVQTYADAGLAVFENLTPMVTVLSNKFKEFADDYEANLGDTITLQLRSRFQAAAGLVTSFNGITQREVPLTCDQAFNVSYTATAQDLVLNLEKRGNNVLPKFAEDAISELATNVENNVSLHVNSAAPVMSIVNGQSVPTGALHTESGPFRFFGNGVDSINQFQQLAQMLTNFRDVGFAPGRCKVIMPETYLPPIIGSGLNQFAPRRNDEISRSWEIGEYGFPSVDYYSSNCLPIHTAGYGGQNAETLTVVSTDDPTGANITQIVCSGATASQSDYVVAGDLARFNDSVSGQPNVRFLKFVGQSTTSPSNQPVQFRVTADADSTGGGQVTLNITPGLTVGASQTSNWGINTNIVAGMQISIMPSHQSGLLMAEDYGFLAMPKLSSTSPFDSHSALDPETGVSVRAYFGELFGQNQRGFVYDEIHGALLVPEGCMRILFPLSVS